MPLIDLDLYKVLWWGGAPGCEETIQPGNSGSMLVKTSRFRTLERPSERYVGNPPVSLSIHRMHVCPKSASAPYIIGQAPAIVLMSC